VTTRPVTARIGFVYPGSYQRTERFGYRGDGIPITGDRTREEVTLWKDWRGTIGSIDLKPRGLGGWALDVQHTYDPVGQVLYLGSGGRQGAQLLGPVVTTPAVGDWLEGMAVAPDGQLYYADSINHRVWRVGPRPNDPIHSYNLPFAGIEVASGQLGGYSGDGGAALDAQLDRPKDVAFGPDGSLYIADYGNRRIRRVAPDGIITTFAGGGMSLQNGDLAINRWLSRPTGVEVGPDGTVYIADYDADNVYRVGTDGRMTKVAGPDGFFFGTDNLAVHALLRHPTDIALAPDGSLYIADTGNNLVRRVDLYGFIQTIAGNGAGPGPIAANGDGGPATQAAIDGPRSVAVAPDGSLYIATDAGEIWRVVPS
jgi:sugar lactone lactonase YvrE